MPKKENAAPAEAPRRHRFLPLVCFVLILAAAYFSLCAYAGTVGIFPQVESGGILLSGMTRDEAAQVLSAAVPDGPLSGRGISFALHTDRDETFPVQVSLSQVRIDGAATAQRAWAVGHSETFPLRGAVYLRCLLSAQDILPVYNGDDALETALDEMDAKVGRLAQESQWVMGKSALTLTKGSPGCYLDREALKADILTRMNNNDLVDLAGSQPQFTVETCQALPGELNFPDILKEVEVPVRDARFDRESKAFCTERIGVSFSPEEAKALFDGMDWGETRDLPLIITQPKVTLSDLTPKLYQDTLGSCTTTISGSENRVHNVTLAAQYFDGVVLMPGEVFSYNTTVGRRTAARGFLPAPAYVSGQSVQETGGGVCQGSSTLYLAALRANLAIVERYNHGYITRYVPEGMDATVYYGAKDFRFKNDTPFPLRIQSAVSGRTLTVNLLGTQTSGITVEMTNKVVGYTSAKTVYKVDPNLPAGVTKVACTPYNGYTVEVYRNLYENGVLIDTKLESSNFYRTRDKIILVSPQDAHRYAISS